MLISGTKKTGNVKFFGVFLGCWISGGFEGRMHRQHNNNDTHESTNPYTNDTHNMANYILLLTNLTIQKWSHFKRITHIYIQRNYTYTTWRMRIPSPSHRLQFLGHNIFMLYVFLATVYHILIRSWFYNFACCINYWSAVPTTITLFAN